MRRGAALRDGAGFCINLNAPARLAYKHEEDDTGPRQQQPRRTVSLSCTRVSSVFIFGCSFFFYSRIDKTSTLSSSLPLRTLPPFLPPFLLPASPLLPLVIIRPPPRPSLLSSFWRHPSTFPSCVLARKELTFEAIVVSMTRIHLHRQANLLNNLNPFRIFLQYQLAKASPESLHCYIDTRLLYRYPVVISIPGCCIDTRFCYIDTQAA